MGLMCPPVDTTRGPPAGEIGYDGGWHCDTYTYNTKGAGPYTFGMQPPPRGFDSQRALGRGGIRDYSKPTRGLMLLLVMLVM